MWLASSSEAGGFCRGFCWLRSGYLLQKEPLSADVVQLWSVLYQLTSHVTVGTQIPGLGLGLETRQQVQCCRRKLSPKRGRCLPLSLTSNSLLQ